MDNRCMGFWNNVPFGMFAKCLQLWHPPFLELIRSTFWGRALIGTSFSWWDFPHYIFGSAIGGFLIEKLKGK